jgi:hypothetical protein
LSRSTGIVGTDLVLDKIGVPKFDVLGDFLYRKDYVPVSLFSEHDLKNLDRFDASQPSQSHRRGQGSKLGRLYRD